MKQLLTSLLASTIAFGAATTVQKYDLEREVDRQRVMWYQNRSLIRAALAISYESRVAYQQTELLVVEQLVNDPGLTDKERLKLYQELNSLRAELEKSKQFLAQSDAQFQEAAEFWATYDQSFMHKHGHRVLDFSNTMIDKNEEEV